MGQVIKDDDNDDDNNNIIIIINIVVQYHRWHGSCESNKGVVALYPVKASFLTFGLASWQQL